MRYSNSMFSGISDFFLDHPNLRRILVLVVLFAILLGCWKIGTGHEATKVRQPSYIPQNETEMKSDFPFLALTDLDQKTEPSAEAVELNLDTVEDGYTITGEGDYLLSGELQGTLRVLCPEGNVHLFLDNVTIKGMGGPAIYCEDADKLVITLQPSSKNVLSDSGSNRFYPETEATVYSTSDMTLNGTGELQVNSYYKDSIRSKDRLRIVNGTYAVKCKRTAFHGNDGIHIADGNFEISSEKYAMKTTKRGVEGRGNLMISGGKYSIIAGRNAFVTMQGDLYIANCTISSKSIVDDFSVGGMKYVQKGCVQ